MENKKELRKCSRCTCTMTADHFSKTRKDEFFKTCDRCRQKQSKYKEKKCPHGKLKRDCVPCGGTCEHGRRKSQCVECGGDGICEKHNVVKYSCWECGLDEHEKETGKRWY